MTFNEYQDAAAKTAVYPESAIITYPVLGLAGEAGEVAGKLAKYHRDKMTMDELVRGLKAEVGDCLWMLAMIANDLGLDLDDIAAANLAKLADRQARGVLKGSGDDR